ncbi:cytochrome bd-I oxidase subunit CydX [Psychromonas sp. Urea-02u-13]|nr:cytochrome bd-I oxidase subunit CydX [Psychromonas sp. Urea-02u-13]PKG38509.1 cytochrome bd-I oxidase subunit CydX [Psychromonas sp. Urea-02u-13]
MWYFAWILGILLACSLGIINGLWLEQVETNEKEELEKEALKKVQQAET